MQPNILIDIETRATKSVVDVGLYTHAPTADILLMWYKIGDGSWQEWRGFYADGITCHSADEPPQDFIDAIRAGSKLYAANAAYERVVLSAQRWCPIISIDQTVCVLAWARAFNLPGNLDGLTNFLLPDNQAKSKLSRRAKLLWDATHDWPDDSVGLMKEQSAYCLRDCTSMEDALEFMPPVDPNWLAVYHANERINDRGAHIDVELCDLVIDLQPAVERGLMEDVERHTDGKVHKLRGPQMKNWLLDTLPEDLVPCLTVDKKVKDGYGWRTEKIVSAGKKARTALYEALDTYEGDFDPTHVVNALHAFEEANKAAVRKFKAAITKATGEILKGQFVQNGASATGRYASYGVQVHNLKRMVHKNFDELLELMREAVAKGGDEAAVHWLEQEAGMSINQLVSGILRPMFMASCQCYWCDWSAIEARVLPWLSDKQSAREGVLEVFINDGDVYKHQARDIFNKPISEVDDDERQAGKVAVLALGFQGGANAYLAMAGNYGLKCSHDFANDIKEKWRAANPWATDWWREVEDAAFRAILQPNVMVPTGRINFQFNPDLFFGTLIGWLPDGSWVCWPEAKIRDVVKFEDSPPTPTIVFTDPTYGKSSTYGGDMAQTFTQAVAARLLWRTLLECEKENVPVILHVHDEVVIDGDAEDARILEEIMNEVPHWAEGLPIKAEVEGGGKRYKLSS